MTPWDVIERLYDSEIDSGVESLCNYGIKAWIKAEDGRVVEQTFLRQEFDEIGAWIDDEACRLFPNSWYAKSDGDAPRSYRHVPPTIRTIS